MNRPKFTAGFNHGQRAQRHRTKVLAPYQLATMSEDFQAGYRAGALVGAFITCEQDATNELNKAWVAVGGNHDVKTAA